MTENSQKSLLFAGRIAPTTKNGPRTVVVNTLRPCWLQEPQRRIAHSVEKLLRDNFQSWLSEAPGFSGVDGSANFRVYATETGLDVVVSAPSSGSLFDKAGRSSICARVGWWIRYKLRSVQVASSQKDWTQTMLPAGDTSC